MLVTLPDMSTPQGKAQKSPGNRKFKLAAVLLALTVFFVIPELLVRALSGTDQERYRAIQFGGDANSEELFVKDHELHWASFLYLYEAIQYVGLLFQLLHHLILE